MYVKEHQTERGKLVAVCDEELLGKTIDNNGIPFVVSEKFYGGRKATPEEVLELIKHCAQANVIGKRSVSYLIDNKLIDGSFIIKVGEHPHVILVNIR
ncbi:MAG: DUF424 family protein [Candidatus Diapherotrites archaeon]|nr:DUF424 family protein [Candidatus Diapherotrites archaeon]